MRVWAQCVPEPLWRGRRAAGRGGGAVALARADCRALPKTMTSRSSSPSAPIASCTASCRSEKTLGRYTVEHLLDLDLERVGQVEPGAARTVRPCHDPLRDELQAQKTRVVAERELCTGIAVGVGDRGEQGKRVGDQSAWTAGEVDAAGPDNQPCRRHRSRTTSPRLLSPTTRRRSSTDV